MTTESFPSKSTFFIPFISFRIVPILFFAPQAAQPGILSFTTLSSAEAVFKQAAKKIKMNNKYVIFFIIRLCVYFVI